MLDLDTLFYRVTCAVQVAVSVFHARSENVDLVRLHKGDGPEHAEFMLRICQTGFTGLHVIIFGLGSEVVPVGPCRASANVS